MWLRQFKRYVRSKSRIVGSLAQPLLFLLALGYGFGPVYQAAGQGNYIDFLAPGIIGMSILFTSMFSGVEVIWDRQFGFLKETLVAPVARTAIMLGRIMGGATVATLQGMIVLVITFLIGFHPVSWALVPVALVVMFVVSALFTGLGSLIGTLIEDMQGFQLIMGFIVMPHSSSPARSFRSQMPPRRSSGSRGSTRSPTVSMRSGRSLSAHQRSASRSTLPCSLRRPRSSSRPAATRSRRCRCSTSTRSIIRPPAQAEPR